MFYSQPRQPKENPAEERERLCNVNSETAMQLRSSVLSGEILCLTGYGVGRPGPSSGQRK